MKIKDIFVKLDGLILNTENSEFKSRESNYHEHGTLFSNDRYKINIGAQLSIVRIK